MRSRFRPHPSKSARNEGRKLVATFLNNVAVAFFLAGVLQPFLIWVQQGRGTSVASAALSLLFLLTAYTFTMLAQAVIKRLED